jgi:S-adenosylmethionine hydrolase
MASLSVPTPGSTTTRWAAGGHALVGPDNGVLLPAARALANVVARGDGEGGRAGEDALEPFAIRGFDPASSTFHGRDVFAPAAAIVHEAGIGSFDEGDDRFEPIADVVDLWFPEPDLRETGATGEVLTVDGFGNAITNVPGDVLDCRFGERVTVDGEATVVARTYADVADGQRLVTVGSHGNVELAANRGRGDGAFGVDIGDVVRFEW